MAAPQASFNLRVLIDIYPPNSISNLVASTDNNEDGKIDLLWTAPGEDTLTGQLSNWPYLVKYDTSSVSELGGSTTSWWDRAQYIYPQAWTPYPPLSMEGSEGNRYMLLTGDTPGTRFYVAIKAVDKNGGWALDANVATALAGDKTPDIPTGLTALAAEQSVYLSWDANPENDIAYYNIFRDSIGVEGPFADYQLIFSTTSVSYLDTTTVYGTTYYYRITAVDTPPVVLESTRTAYVAIRPMPPELFALSDLTGLAMATDSILWQWTDTNIAEQGHRIYESTGTSGILITTLPADTTYWLENNLSPNTLYTRYVYAYNALGNGPLLAPATVYTLANPPTALISLNQTSFTTELY